MSRVIVDIVAYVLFLLLLMTVAYSNHSPHSFNMFEQHRRAIVNGDYGDKSFALSAVSTAGAL